MKKTLIIKFIKDTFKLFVMISLTLGLIVWIIQAVNFLDFVTEDGHGFKVYFLYTFFNFPKIIHRILPFVFFISLFYQIIKYEKNNELLILWTNGIKKIQFINIVILYSLLILVFQIFLGSYISPKAQNESRSYIRSSNIDFFPSLIKEGKFIDTLAGVTIFIDSKDELGNYKNIYLKDTSIKNGLEDSYQIIYAKSGYLTNENSEKVFVFNNGEIINKENNKITNFTFDKINYNLEKYQSKSSGYPKLQEVPIIDLYMCIYLNFKDEINKFRAEYLQCKQKTMNDIQQEFLKRTYKPIYLPLIALMCGLIIIRSKENNNYNKFNFFLFLLIFFILIISEISLRFSSGNQVGLLFFTLFPLLLFSALYITLIIKKKL
ncbi:LptF/LptG family permease [bacterium]|nr:LptF/LptG family permease [bacterium]